jgi:CPA1 family monovalent cation:H+ antiporter
VYPATYLPRLLVPAIRASDPSPDWRMPFLVAFTGLRGAVSLVGALLIPTMIGGMLFPDREVVLFATYAVIVVTLVGLGLTLRPVVRMLRLAEAGEDESAANHRDERQVRLEALDAVLQRIDPTSGSVAEALRRAYADRRARLLASAEAPEPPDTPARCALELRLIDAERQSIAEAYERNRITDEARRRIERELDLEEARVRHAMSGASR